MYKINGGIKEMMRRLSEIAKKLQLSSEKLFLYVLTHWNSTYLMLAAILKFREVFLKYEDRDKSFHWVSAVEEWVKVEILCQLLEDFDEVTNLELTTQLLIYSF
jgi:hypothetical protein